MPFDKDTLMAQAEARTAQADLRTEQANTRTDEANVRTVEADSRTAEANTRTAQADLRTGKAEAQGDALRVSELSYRRLFESARDGILILDAETGRIVDVNPFLTELLGFSHGDMLGKTVGELSPFKDLLSNQAMLEQLQKDGYIRYEDLPLETRDGRRIFVEFVCNVYQVGDQKVIQCNIRDITERKRVEATMIASEARYRRLFETAKDGILILNAQTGRIVDVNPFLTELLGYTRETFVGKQLWELGFFKDIAASQANFLELQAKDYIRYDDLALETRDGRRIEVEFVSNAYMVDDFRVMQCNIRDITASKRAEESLARLGMAVEQSAETIVITDIEGIMLYVNPAFEQTTGFTRAEALGQNPRILKSGRHDAGFYRQMWAVLKRGEVWHGHLFNRRKDGKIFEEDATLSPVRDAAGKVINYVAVKRDVTHEAQLEAQARQMQKMEAIGTLAGGVAHDFNNILMIISMEAALLKSSGGLSPEQQKNADEIGTTVDRAAALTRQLLLFSRREELQLRDLELSASITNTTKMLRRILGENIEVVLNFAAQPLFIHADASMMDQVLLNLAINARDAMPAGGRLVIETAAVEFDEFAAAQSAPARPGSFVCLSVADTGCGIPPEILPRIFEPFFTTKGVGKGTGLGLATTFGIIQQHHGWINVYSEVGRGTTFRVYLPRLVGLNAQNSAQQMPGPVPTGNETILLVEDERALRTTMRLTLTRLGYRVLEASTGLKALAVWQEHRDDIRLLLTDLIMPDGMIGRDLAQRLIRENPRLKVIYMSGYSADLISQDFNVQENVNFLAKPFHAQQLAQTIRDSLDKPAYKSGVGDGP
jgi:PAS domain S-box-containing protein